MMKNAQVEAEPVFRETPHGANEIRPQAELIVALRLDEPSDAFHERVVSQRAQQRLRALTVLKRRVRNDASDTRILSRHVANPGDLVQ